MKTIAKIMIVLVVSSFGLASCKRDLAMATKADATTTLKVSLPGAIASTVTLVKDDPTAAVLHAAWSKPQFLTDTTLGNVSMRYRLQFDVNELFAKPINIDFATKRDSVFSSGALNAILNELGFASDVAGKLYLRVECISSTNTIWSNTYSFLVIPYSLVVKPKITVPEALIITGAAVPGAWVTPFPAAQRFTKLNATTYTLTAELLGGKPYELITDVNGNNWTPCYHIAPTDDPSALRFGGNFIEDGDGTPYNWSGKAFLTPAENGIYKLSFDFQSATFKVEKM